jgi:hypothetical protein
VASGAPPHAGCTLVALSATLHDGYDDSFVALLGLLDPHCFVRGIKPTREVMREITVRRLKSEFVNDNGTPLSEAHDRPARGRAP